MKGWDDPRQLRTFAAVLAEVDRRKLGELVAQQAIAVVMVECSGLNYANPLYPWTLAGSDGYPPTALAPSTKESCGITQIRPHIPVWWGPEGLSIREQSLYFMVPGNSINLFLDRLIGAYPAEPWQQIQQVQGSEYDGVTINRATGRPYPYAGNYQAVWQAAGQLLTELRASSPAAAPHTILEWIMTAPDQAALAAYAAVVGAEAATRTIWGGVNDGTAADLWWNGPRALRQAVLDQIGNEAVWGVQVNGHTVADLLWHLRDGRPATANLVRAPITEDPSGAVYAVTSESFWHIPGGPTFDAGKTVGLWGDDIREVPLAQITLLAKYLGGELYDGKPHPNPVTAVASPAVKATIAVPVSTPIVPLQPPEAKAT